MRWIWVFIWLFLLLVQITHYGMKTILARPVPDMIRVPGREYLELARETNKMWDVLLDPGDGLPDDGNPDRSTNGLMEREEWLMRLDELLSRLGDNGYQVQLKDDVEKWLISRRKTKEYQGSEHINRYLANLYGWLEALHENMAGVQLDGLRLEPAVMSDFPNLYFEFEGNPLPVGRSLLATGKRSAYWSVQEIDLYCNENSDTWWLQGSFKYNPDG